LIAGEPQLTVIEFLDLIEIRFAASSAAKRVLR
jgi:hypothetical protein